MNKLLAALILLLVSSTAAASAFRHFDEWTTEEKAWFAAYGLSSYVDYKQTMHATSLRNADGSYVYEERNPLLGTRPTEAKVLGLKLLAGAYLYHNIGKWGFETKRTKRTTIAVTMMQVAVVVHNDSLGVGFNVAL